MSTNDLRALEPTDAVESFLADKRTDGLSDRSLQTYRRHLEDFLGWCDRQDVTEMAEVDVLAWKDYKADLAGRVADSTRSNRLGTVNRLLEFCADIDAVERDVSDRIEVERVTNVRDDAVSADEAEAILEYLRRFRYASIEHVTFELLWHIGCRLGTLQAFDVDDVNPEGTEVNGRKVGPHIQARHRPTTGTPLKNGEAGERPIALGEDTVKVVTDYMDHTRPDVTDDYGREPLVATYKGRASHTFIRARIYRLTQPCFRGEACPLGRDPTDCKAAQNRRDARECPEAESPHAIRRGRLTAYSRDEIPDEVISDRADVSPDILEKHYNTMADEEKMEQRRSYLDNL